MIQRSLPAALAIVLFAAFDVSAQAERWDKDIGKKAPRLYPSGWVGTPVSLDALRKGSDGTESAEAGETVAKRASIGGGNTVVLAFWDADIPC